MNPWGIFWSFAQDEENFYVIYWDLIIKAAVHSDPKDPISLQYKQGINIGFLP